MGQSNERAWRISLLKHNAVGPCEFNYHNLRLVFMSRTDQDTMARMRSALRDLLPMHGINRLVNSIDQATLNKASWAVVTLMHDGPVAFDLIAPIDDAIDYIVQRYGQGFLERRLSWSTLTFGTVGDVEAARKAALRFGELNASASIMHPSNPKVGVVSTTPPKLLLEIPRNYIEDRDLSGTLMTLDGFQTNSEFLDRIGASFVLSFDGYEEDPRFISEIPEVESYIEGILEYAPWAPLVSDQSIFLIWCKALDSECRVKARNDGNTEVYLSPEVMERIGKRLSMTAADLCINRLMLQEIHPSIMRAVELWNEFFANASDKPIHEYADDESVDEDKSIDPKQVANEHEFWQSVSQEFAPGWMTGFVESEEQKTPNFAEMAVKVYVLDTKTGWVIAGGLTVEQAEILDKKARNSENAHGLTNIAITKTRSLADQRANAEDPETRLAIFAAFGTICTTQMFKMAKEQYSSMDRHYLLMVYSPRSTQEFSRCAVLTPPPGTVFLPLIEVYEIAAVSIARDIKNSTGIVGGQIKAGGGLELCDLLQDQVTQELGSASK